MARENQGLQIGLILFVIIAVALGVTTYMFKSDTDAALVKVAALEKEKREVQTAADAVANDNNLLRSYLGFPATEAVTAIDAARKADFATYGSKDVPEDGQNYRALVTSMAATIRAKEVALEKADADAKTAVAAAAAKERDAATAIAAHKEAFDKLSGQFAEVKAAFDQEVATHRAAKDAVAGKVDGLEKVVAQVRQDANAVKLGLEKKLQDAAVEYGKAKKKIDDIDTTNFNLPAGKITFVSQRENIVYLNLGRDDRLKKGLSFSVFSPNENNVAQGKKKGSIEVIEVHESHAAVAKIIESTLSDPLLPGDVIWSPIWQVGQQQHFAITGNVDLDGDGRSDLQRVRDLITLNGGVVDAYYDERGKIVGAINYNTRYLIRGEPPTEKTEETIRTAYSKLISDAQRLSVELIPLQKFLGLVGGAPKTQTVSAGSARAFSPRSAPGAEGAGSAFRTRPAPGAAPAGDGAAAPAGAGAAVAAPE